MARISYSQYSTWHQCPHQFKLSYIDKLSTFSGNIHTIFGSAIHETVQHFLSVMYGVSKKQAMELDLAKLLKKNLITEFKSGKEKQKGIEPCTQGELEEAFSDGRRTLTYFRNKLSKLYTKSGFELIGIELQLNATIRENIYFIGYIDVVLKDKAADMIVIIDLKTSIRGWSKYQKNDKVKLSQLLLYKKFYSEKYGVPIEKIKVEYHILKRKVDEEAEYPIPRISKFIPANGKPSMNMAWKDFMKFVDTVFDENGKHRDIEFYTKQTKLCDYCEYKTRKLCKDFKL